ncbi:MAG: protein-L-isoaspartate O-methyltransferase [Gammaproteobacteria bacterium]
MDTNIELARSRMIEHQIRAWNVLDVRVLEILSEMPREEFVPAAYRNLAFADLSIPLAHGQCMMAPKIEGRLLQALALTPGEEVLEIGTGTGFLAACMHKLGGRVHSIDISPDFVDAALSRFEALDIGGITAECVDANLMSSDRRYDTIALTASLPAYNDRYARSLKVGGRLFVIVGQAPVMDARLITRVAEQEWLAVSLFETDLTPLINAPKPPTFEF